MQAVRGLGRDQDSSATQRVCETVRVMGRPQFAAHLHRRMCTPLRCRHPPSTSASTRSMGPTCRTTTSRFLMKQCFHWCFREKSEQSLKSKNTVDLYNRVMYKDSLFPTTH